MDKQRQKFYPAVDVVIKGSCVFDLIAILNSNGYAVVSKKINPDSNETRIKAFSPDTIIESSDLNF